MDRRLLFPAIVATAWGQQAAPAPVPAPATAAEKAVRARVEEFYQLEVDKKFRQAESLVAEESKDDFYNGSKPVLKNFAIKTIELTDNDTRAKVMVTIKTTVNMPGFVGQVMEFPSVTKWKLVDGQWFWYVATDDQVETPFGKMTRGYGPTDGSKTDAPNKIVIPDLATFQAQVTISRQAVVLSQDAPVQTVTVSNAMSNPIGVEISDNKIEGVSIELEKKEVKPGDKGELRFRLTGKAKASGKVRVTCSPIGNEFDILVTAN